MCGKDAVFWSTSSFCQGSPPRVRERPRKYTCRQQAQGITPACAGKTLEAMGVSHLWEDHPRVCGKDARFFSLASETLGSPPRVRERQFGIFNCFGVNRITPACAGKTELTNSHIFTVQDHPRVCGKDLKVRLKLRRLRGSPPRVRERLSLLCVEVDSCGITPACAGKTLPRF